jgi:hypothetical protein
MEKWNAMLRYWICVMRCMRTSLSCELKDIVEDLQMSLGKRDDTAVQDKIQSYFHSVKKAKKHFVKAATVTFDKEDCRILKLLSKATGITAFNLTVQLQGKQITTTTTTT